MGYLNQVSDADIKKAKEENSGIKLNVIEFTLDDGEVFEGIFKAPSPESFQRYQADAGKRGDESGLNASIRYVKDNLVSPDWEKFYEVHKTRPALVVQVANELVKGMGYVQDVKKKAI